LCCFSSMTKPFKVSLLASMGSTAVHAATTLCPHHARLREPAWRPSNRNGCLPICFDCCESEHLT
jgi:hypothetical protein